jgi:hypothetical protein
MFAQYLFNLLSNLLSSRRLSGHADHCLLNSIFLIKP